MSLANLSNAEILALPSPDEDGDVVMTPTEVQAAPEAAKPTDEPQAEVPEVPAAEPEVQAPEATPEPEVEIPKRDREAVKAARAGERRALRELDEVRAEVERLRKAAPAAPALPVLDEKTAEDLKEYAPSAIDAIKARDAELERLRALNAQLAKQQPEKREFQPERLAADQQDAVDEVPDLVAWQHNQDQTDWNRVKEIDTYLAGHPAWKDKPMVERFAELALRRNAEKAKATTPPPKPKPTAEDAKRVIEEKAKVEPLSVGDLRGRTPPNQVKSHRNEWASKSNEQLIAELPDFGFD